MRSNRRQAFSTIFASSLVAAKGSLSSAGNYDAVIKPDSSCVYDYKTAAEILQIPLPRIVSWIRGGAVVTSLTRDWKYNAEYDGEEHLYMLWYGRSLGGLEPYYFHFKDLCFIEFINQTGDCVGEGALCELRFKWEFDYENWNGCDAVCFRLWLENNEPFMDITVDMKQIVQEVNNKIRIYRSGLNSVV